MLRIITLLDLTKPLFNALDSLLMLACGLVCIRSLRRRFDAGVLLIAIAALISFVGTAFFVVFALHSEWKIMLSASSRQALYLITGLMYPFQVFTFPLGIILVVRRYGVSLPPPLSPDHRA